MGTPEETLPTCAMLKDMATWERIPNSSNRWHAVGDPRKQPPEEFYSEEYEVTTFPSIDKSKSISIVKCSDGGAISYELPSGEWLHTLQLKTEFRLKIFELNLVPIQELRAFLVPECDEDADPAYNGNSAS